VSSLPLFSVVVADLADLVTVEAALSATVTGPLDGLVHCAGVVRPGPLSATSAADFREQFEINVTAAAEVTRVLLPALRAAHGTVVFVNSGSGLVAREPLAAYGASKFALRAYADALRVAEPSIRVSSLFPGRTATDMQGSVRAAEAGEYDTSQYLAPSTVAGVLSTMLLLPADGVITDLTLRPRPH